MARSSSAPRPPKPSRFYRPELWTILTDCNTSGEAVGLDIFIKKLAAKGLFDNKREWARFREMILSISSTSRPDYMAKVEEYLGRPFNQDIFVYCTTEVEDQLKQQRAASEAAAKAPARGAVDIWNLSTNLHPSEGEESLDNELSLNGEAGQGDLRVEWWDLDEPVAVVKTRPGEDLGKVAGEEDVAEEELDDIEAEEGPDDDHEVATMEETPTV